MFRRQRSEFGGRAEVARPVLYERSAIYVDKILKNSVSWRVEQPSKFAQSLGFQRCWHKSIRYSNSKAISGFGPIATNCVAIRPRSLSGHSGNRQAVAGRNCNEQRRTGCKITGDS
jgi:hypothetical protein